MAIGVSIYPHLLIGQEKQLEQYLSKCANAGVKIIFTTMINFKKDNLELITLFKKMTAGAKKLGIVVYGDINGEVYEEFGLDKNNREQLMHFFKDELGLAGLRFDDGIDGVGIAKLSNNPNQFKIILNAASPSMELEYLISLGANKDNLLACWNFYPQRYTGVGVDYFLDNLDYIKNNGVKVQAFAALQREDAQGPWKHNDKLPTLELHRDESLNFQIRHLKALGVDDIIISTQFLNEEEFKEVKNLDLTKLHFNLLPNQNLTLAELEILNDQTVHFVRPDLAEFVIRSTFSRLKYQGVNIIPQSEQPQYFEPGDVLILNDKAQNYAGELQIVLKQIKNDGIRNLVGKLSPVEGYLIETLEPNQEFAFSILDN
ncbi:outer surface protein [Spiroplasma syrphidicola EA-1]|uniref:Outer surface protein n=1 Tax=Spiroplasma syrphidicola EA-1 TaxID=1276229 RepID=R4U566_9MOLU|nr:MupG family TIM beta-alpha barrel fold protein [Spiroplasma syrphidicola]AGM25698.1 outer surface protein [Spiroplasma syrphidicola EA-1]